MSRRPHPAHARRSEPRRGRGHWAWLVLLGVVVAATLALHAQTLLASRRTGTAATPGASAHATGPVLEAGAHGAVVYARPAAKTVALTFDDGPDPRWTPRVLDVLRRHGVPATFFVVGTHVLDHPDLVRAEVAAGDEVGVHTFTHAELSEQPAWRRGLELAWTQDALAHATGLQTRLLRPPYSSTPDALTVPELDALREPTAEGYLGVLATTDTEDWRRPGADEIADAALAAAPTGGGRILLLHDGGGDRSQTVRALDQLIPRLQAQGYRFGTVSEVLGRPGGADLRPAGTAARVRGAVLAVVMATASTLVTGMGRLLLVVAALGLARSLALVVLARRHAGRQPRRPRPDVPDRGLRPSVAVVVPAYNEEAGIEATLRSLAASRYDGPLRILVVDDGSTDATVDRVHAVREALRAEGVAVPVDLVRQANAGKATALNTGIAACDGEIVVLLDGDTVFEPDTIACLVRPFADPRVGAVSGNTKVANRGGMLGRWQHVEYVLGFNLDRRMFDELQCMQTIPGAIGAFRREVLDAVGGVPVDTLAEDTDLTLLIGLAGWAVTYADDAIAWTEAPATWRALWSQRFRWCYGTLQAAWKHRGALLGRRRVGPTGAVTHVGRRGLPYLWGFGIVFPLLAPLVDLFGVYGMFVAPPGRVAALWLGFTAVQAGLAAYALHLDGERMRDAWVVPFQLVAYRQLMYLVAVESAVSAVRGHRLRWQKLRRLGAAAAALERVG